MMQNERLCRLFAIATHALLKMSKTYLFETGPKQNWIVFIVYVT